MHVHSVIDMSHSERIFSMSEDSGGLMFNQYALQSKFNTVALFVSFVCLFCFVYLFFVFFCFFLFF